MEMQPSLNTFYELMDHEFEGISITHEKLGYRVDRNGIKVHCKYANLKSVDYFHEIDEKTNFIEFSDLARQHASIMERIAHFKKCDLPKREITNNVKRLHKEIGNELKHKYMDSISIIRKVPKVFDDVPEWMTEGNAKYIVVVAPLSSEVNDSEANDIIRILEKLKDDLTCSIPDDLLLSIKILPVDKFLKQVTK